MFLSPAVCRANIQRAYRRRLVRLGPKRNGKSITVAGGKAAAAVFASVLGVGAGGGSDSTNQLARLTSTARTTLVGASGAFRLTGTAAGLTLNGESRNSLVLKVVGPFSGCSDHGARAQRARDRKLGQMVDGTQRSAGWNCCLNEKSVG